jgi:hypothetical protein
MLQAMIPKNGPFWAGKKDCFENKASATAPVSNNRLSEFLRTFPAVIELSTFRLKTGSVSAPTLSICGFRYLSDRWADLNELSELNGRIHRRMVQRGHAIPSTTMVDGMLAIRPCFIGARTTLKEADELVNEVLAIGHEVARMDEQAVG